MSDKNYVPASGQTYQVKRGPGGILEVSTEGKKDTAKITLRLDRHNIDSQTTRFHFEHEKSRGLYWVYARGNKRVLSWPGGSIELDAAEASEGGGSSAGALKPLKLTMPGKVLSVKVKEGDIVEAGQGLVIVEAMKMENILLAPARAKIGTVKIKDGDRLESGAVLLTFEPAE
jgi:acetyl/propionyl-CoA carboxylase alpha subunit